MSITWKEKVSFQLLTNYWILNMWHQIFFLETLRTSSKHVFKNLSMLGFPRENACCQCKFFFWIWRPKILIFGHTLKFYCLKITDFTYLLFVPNLILQRTNWLWVLNFFSQRANENTQDDLNLTHNCSHTNKIFSARKLILSNPHLS